MATLIIRHYGETSFVGETEICFRVRLFKIFYSILPHARTLTQTHAREHGAILFIGHMFRPGDS